MVVLGDEGIDVDHLHRATQPALRRIDLILTDRAVDTAVDTAPEKAAEGV